MQAVRTASVAVVQETEEVVAVESTSAAEVEDTLVAE